MRDVVASLRSLPGVLLVCSVACVFAVVVYAASAPSKPVAETVYDPASHAQQVAMNVQLQMIALELTRLRLRLEGTFPAPTAESP